MKTDTTFRLLDLMASLPKPNIALSELQKAPELESNDLASLQALYFALTSLEEAGMLEWRGNSIRLTDAGFASHALQCEEILA